MGLVGEREGDASLYALAAIAALAVALPLRSSDGGLRAAAWAIALVLLGSGLMLTRGTVERRAQAGAEVSALIVALAETADAMPAESCAFVIVPGRIGSIPFARNAQGSLMSPPVQSSRCRSDWSCSSPTSSRSGHQCWGTTSSAA